MKKRGRESEKIKKRKMKKRGRESEKIKKRK